MSENATNGGAEPCLKALPTSVRSVRRVSVPVFIEVTFESDDDLEAEVLAVEMLRASRIEVDGGAARFLGPIGPIVSGD